MAKQWIAVSAVEHMAAQWDYEKNTEDICQVNALEKEKDYHWKCSKCGYEWTSSPAARYKSTGKCMCCDLKRVIVKGVNDLFTIYPKAIHSYDFEKNKDIDPYQIARMDTTLYWLCPKCQYSWQAMIHSRAVKGFRCPCCDANKYFKKGINDIFTRVPGLIDYYDFEKNGDFDIYSQGVGSFESVHWKCDVCGNHWQSPITFMIRREEGMHVPVKCRQCHPTRRKSCDIPPVSEVPDLIKFWDYEKNTRDPAATSSAETDSAFWKCPYCGYEWTSKIYRIGSNPLKCPCCETNRVIRKGVNDLFTLLPDAAGTYNYEKNKDVNIETLGIASKTGVWWRCNDCGYEWHSSVRARVENVNGTYSLRKHNCYCNTTFSSAASDPRLVRFWDFSRNKAAGLDINLLSVQSNLIAYWKCRDCGYEWEASIISRYRSKAQCPFCESGSKVRPGFNDVLTLVPDFASIYDFEKNKDLDIHSLSPFSRQQAYFKCRACGNEWRSPIYHRTRRYGENDIRLVGCTVCDNKNHRKQTYGEEYPELEQMYNKELNKRPLSSFRSADAHNVKCWWDCMRCGNTFQATIHSKIDSLKRSSKGCPYCAYNRVNPDKSLEKVHPELMHEWDFVNNYLLADICKTGEGSVKPVWWICQNDSSHRYSMRPKQRVLFMKRGREPCPYCKGLRPKKRHFV